MMQNDVHYAQNYSNDDADPVKPWIGQEGIRWLDVVGRATGGPMTTAIETAYRASVADAAERIGDPADRSRFLQQKLVIIPAGLGLSNLRARFAPPLFAVFGMAGLILLIACANTANLLLARAAVRQREFAVRLSIGASRSRLVRQLLTESLLLAGIATAAGLMFAGRAGDLLVRQALGSTGPAPFSVGVTWRVLAFTFTVSIVTVVLFGLVPAFRTTSLPLATALKVAGARASTARSSLQKSLVTAQVALSLVLLVGAGLFVRTLQNYASVPLGFSQDHILTASINPRAVGYPLERLPQLYRDLVARVESVPGVSSASVALCALATGCERISGIAIEGYSAKAGEDLRLQENTVSLNYLATTGMRLLEGRDFNDRDRENTPKVAIVNRAMVRRFFPDGRAVGRRLGYDTPDTEIVGVVDDARVNRIQDSPRPMVFYPLAQAPAAASSLDVRAVGDPRLIVNEVRRAVAEVDPVLPVDRVTILSEQVSRGLRQERLVAGLTSIFGILALGLACVGLFGVMSYVVSGRTAEFGIRMALGAQRSQVLRSIFRESLTVVAYGLAAGIPAALIASLLLSDLLFGVSPSDPMTVAVAAVLLAGVAAIAGLLPAWRASRVDPMVALRQE